MKKKLMRQNKITYIYVLKCPITDVVKYVGKTINIDKRLKSHINEKNNTLKCKWMIGLKSKGLLPVFEVIDEVGPLGDWEAKEKHYISYYKSIGQAFCNQTDGGESGSFKGLKLTDKHKESISKSNVGMPNPAACLSNKINKGVKVNQMDLSGNIVKTHLSIRDAALAVNRNYRRIQAMCKYGHINGKSINQVGGYKFEYSHEAND